jgi:hypothetical protein
VAEPIAVFRRVVSLDRRRDVLGFRWCVMDVRVAHDRHDSLCVGVHRVDQLALRSSEVMY